MKKLLSIVLSMVLVLGLTNISYGQDLSEKIEDFSLDFVTSVLWDFADSKDIDEDIVVNEKARDYIKHKRAINQLRAYTGGRSQALDDYKLKDIQLDPMEDGLYNVSVELEVDFLSGGEMSYYEPRYRLVVRPEDENIKVLAVFADDLSTTNLHEPLMRIDTEDLPLDYQYKDAEKFYDYKESINKLVASEEDRLRDQPDTKDEIKDHWALFFMSWAVDSDLIIGYDDKTLRPDDTITWAEVLTVAARLKGHDLEISEGSGWYEDALALGLEEGYVNEGISPDEPITREDLAGLLFDIDPKESDHKSKFLDYDQIDRTDAIDYLGFKGVIDGYPDGTFMPKNLITRAEAAKVFFYYDYMVNI